MKQIFIDSQETFNVRPIFPDRGMPAATAMIAAETPSVENFRGFGAAITGSSCYLLSRMESAARTALLKELYSPGGLNLSVGRISIGSSDYSPELYSYDDEPFDTELKHFSIARDEAYIIPMIKEILAIRPDLMLFASPWSPPAWMKTGGNLCGGYMRSEFVECYAEYTVRFLQAYARHGIKISALTPQNEPETAQGGDMPACIWHPEIECAYVQTLRRKLDAAKLETEIWLYDHTFSGVERVRWCLKQNNATRESLRGVAFHYYTGAIEQTRSLRTEFPELALHFTEGGPRLRDHYDSDWCKWGEMIAKAIACGYSSFTGWNLMLDESGFPNIGPFFCGGLVTRHSKTGEIIKSGQYKAFERIANAIESADKLFPLEAQDDFSSMCVYPAPPKRKVTGFKIRKPSGREIVILVNPAESAKAQVRFRANGENWYAELPPNSISTIME